MSTKRVLITGSSGFTGRHAVQLLSERGYSVYGLAHTSTGAANELVGNITDKQSLRECVQRIQPDYVLHLAALAFVGYGDLKEFYNVNVIGTLNLLEVLAELAVPPTKIVVASSANIYGAPDHIEILDEGVSPAPISHYAASKMAMEYLVRTWFDRLPIIITRPFNYTGQGQSSIYLVPKIVTHFKNKAAEIELGNIDVARDFSDVRDVVNAYAQLIESDVQADVFNVCSGKSYALRHIIDCMERIAGYQIEVKVNPAFVRANEIPRLVGDNGKLIRKVGYKPRYSLEETLESMFLSRE